MNLLRRKAIVPCALVLAAIGLLPPSSSAASLAVYGCARSVATVQDQSFRAGSFLCEASTSITTGPKVAVNSGADLELNAPAVVLDNGLTVQGNGTLSIANTITAPAAIPTDSNRFLRFLNHSPGLTPGIYTVVAATKAPGQVAPFLLQITRDRATPEHIAGQWSGSGGMDPTSPNNPRFAIEISQTSGVTLDLLSPADSYLYLLDQSGAVIAEDDNSGATPSTPWAARIDKPDVFTDNEANALAYYAAIDPYNEKLTLNNWKAANGFQPSVDPEAIYVNDADLGFGRHMVVHTNPDGSVASYVENYGDNQGGVDGPAEQKILNARDRIGLIATVAMEYGPSPIAVLRSATGYATSNAVITHDVDPGVYVLAVEGVGNGVFSVQIQHENGSTEVFTGQWPAQLPDPTYGLPYNPDRPRFYLNINQSERIVATLIDSSGTTGGYSLYLLGEGGPFFTKFYTFGPDGSRLTAADLDGRGLKYQPGVCNVCHGGTPKALVNGVYPEAGDTGAGFLPWDLDTLLYSQTDPLLTRAVLEPVFKKFNEAVLGTYPLPHTVSYAGPPVTVPANGSATIDLPVSGFAEALHQLSVTIESIDLPTALDVSIDLYPPNSLDSLRVIDTYGPSGANFRDTFLTDLACHDIDQAPGDAAPFTGAWMPSDAYGFGTDYSGELKRYEPSVSANGVWQLRMTNYTSVPGTVNAWSLHFNGIPDTARLPAPVELIQGWYGGPGLPSPIFNGQFVPEGWLPPQAPVEAAELYHKVMATTCRACHIQRGGFRSDHLDFDTYDEFIAQADEIERLVYDEGVMPLAKRTFERFWADPNNPGAVLGAHLPGYVDRLVDPALQEPGHPIADAGPDRQASLGSPVRLKGSASAFAEQYRWRLLSQPAGASASLAFADAATPEFTPNATGNYVFELVVSNGATESPSDTVTVSVPGALPATVFPIVDCTLSTCHSYSSEHIPKQPGRINADNSRMLQHVNYDDPWKSAIARKPMGDHHCGGIQPGFDNATGDDAALQQMIQWMLEGAQLPAGSLP